jgi:hypothetical protein
LRFSRAGCILLAMDAASQLSEDVVKAPVPRRWRNGRVASPKRRKQASKAVYITLGHIDQRSEAWKRARQLIETLELERGGPDHITEGMRQLVQRAAVLSAVIENMEAMWVAGSPIDMAGYLSAIGVQRRVLLSLGLERQAPRDVTTSLSGYLADKSEVSDDQV